MTILFAGTEPDSFKYNGSVTFSTTAGYFDPTYVRGAMYFSSGSRADVGAYTPPGSKDTWFHFESRMPATNGSTCSIEGQGAASAPAFRWNVIGTADPVFQYWNGSSYVTLVTIPFNSLLKIVDIEYRNTVSGRIAVYVDNILMAEVLGDFSTYNDVTTLAVFNRNTNGIYISQVIIADEPTIGFKLSYNQPTAGGTYTAWTGTFDDVDNTIPTDLTFISSSTPDQRENFAKAAFSVPTGQRVKAVGVQARARRGASGPANIAFSLRFGSTDYDSSDIPLALDFNPLQAFWAVNPATALEWTPADAGSATVEFGVKART